MHTFMRLLDYIFYDAGYKLCGFMPNVNQWSILQLLPPCDIGQWHPVAAQSKKSSIQAPQPTNDLDPLDVDRLLVSFQIIIV